MELVKKTVDEWLNDIDYSIDSSYVPSSFALEFITFIKLINGEQGEEHKTPVIHYKMLDNVVGKKQNIANMCSRGLAKALPVSSTVFTENGRKTISDIQVGDKIFGEDGKLTTITHKSEIFHKTMYALHFADGRVQKVSEDHINVLMHNNIRKNITVVDLQKQSTKDHNGYVSSFWIPSCQPIDYSPKDFPIEPYTLGLLLSNGTKHPKTDYVQLAGYIRDFTHFEKHIPYNLGKKQVYTSGSEIISQHIKEVDKYLQELGVQLGTSYIHIPEEYLRGSIEQRISLLHGLMDTKGTVHAKGKATYISNSLNLCRNLVDLVRSLGGIAYTSAITPSGYQVTIEAGFNVFSLYRKAVNYSPSSVKGVALLRVEEIPCEPSQCIAVDNSQHTFIADQYTVTHNTTVLAEYLFLWVAVYGEIPGFGNIDYAIYVSDSIDNGVKKMRLRLERRVKNSEFLQHVLGDYKFTDIRWYFQNKSGKEFVVTGHGAKACSTDTILWTDLGPVTMGDIQVGNYVYGSDGKLAKVLQKSKVFNKPMYRITLEDGRYLEVSEDHYNSVICEGKLEVLTTLELLQKPIWDITLDGNKTYRYYIQNCSPIQYPTRTLPMDPYLLGLILGDGSFNSDGETVVYMRKYSLKEYLNKLPYNVCIEHIDIAPHTKVKMYLKNADKDWKQWKLDEKKHIPEIYFYGSVSQRLSLLQGFLENTGTESTDGTISVCSHSLRLLKDISKLVWSLGGNVQYSQVFNKYPHCRHIHKLDIKIDFQQFQISRNTTRDKSTHFTQTAIVSIERIEDKPSQCISVDNENHEYLVNNYIRTHNTGVRGTVELNTRPQLAVLDDMLDDEDSRSPTIIENIENVIYSAIMHALHPTRRKIIWSGTPFNAKDPLYKAVESGAWYVNVYPVCEQFPCSREEFRGAWEDRFTYDFVKEQYNIAKNSGKLDSFNQELMLRIMSDDERLIEDSDIMWYKRRHVLTNRHAYNFYITTDFATSNKEHADFSVINVWALNSIGSWYWVDGFCKRALMDESINNLFRLVQEYRPQEVGVEVTGQQGGFINWLQNEMGYRNIYFTLSTGKDSNKIGIRPTKDKMSRFQQNAVPLFKSKKIWFPEELKDSKELREMLQEITLATFKGFKSKHDDQIDTITMLPELNSWRPSEEAMEEYAFENENDHDLWDIDNNKYVENTSSYFVD